ncbi:hypothetical protein ACKFKF_32965 [Phormidesmis sp. 146-12]
MKKQALLLSGAIMLTVGMASLASCQETVTQPSAQPSPTPVDFPHWRIVLVDQSSRSPDFASFLQTLRQAVQKRDVTFIRSIVTEETQFGFGPHRSLSYLNPDNPNSPFWSQLEKAIAPGCTDEATLPQPNQEPLFSCPTVFRQFDQAVKTAPQKPLAYETSVVIVGEAIVRSQPIANSPSVAVLENEIVQADQATLEASPQPLKDETLSPNNLNGWTPVILPNDRRGYVPNRQAYRPLGYRAVFAKKGDRWILQAFVSGD